MSEDRVERISALLKEAAELHHSVYRIVDGDDPDWAWWYADWLVNLSELPQVLGREPSRSEIVYLLITADRDHRAQAPDEPFNDFYAREIVAHFE